MGDWHLVCPAQFAGVKAGLRDIERIHKLQNRRPCNREIKRSRLGAAAAAPFLFSADNTAAPLETDVKA
ncbi:MAG: hypothetical protein K0S39_1241 [Paenibacillus sp.]|jgi:hypothetical protein|nr:hypothetical protein [Paenibacillus sp.]